MQPINLAGHLTFKKYNFSYTYIIRTFGLWYLCTPLDHVGFYFGLTPSSLFRDLAKSRPETESAGTHAPLPRRQALPKNTGPLTLAVFTEPSEPALRSNSKGRFADFVLSIAYVDISTLTRRQWWHQASLRRKIEQIADSIRAFGMVRQILVGRDGEIIAGRALYEAALLLGLKEVPVSDISHLSRAEQRAYAIADNKLAENAPWISRHSPQSLNFCRASTSPSPPRSQASRAWKSTCFSTRSRRGGRRPRRRGARRYA